ncbi:hypothetical protein MMC13_004203 [Lambiella insularis]|nr:hypothetical protein [Lambiella insularis]
MSSPRPTLEFLGQIAYQFSLVQPYIPTYLHLIVSALFPIYTGAHASLSKPSSAAKPPKRKKGSEESEDEDNNAAAETSQRMEGLSPWDAILYPVLTGCMLAGLYFLIKWLKDPAILNKILNWYLSIFGIFSIAKLVSDCMNTATSFLFPARYYDSGSFWEVQRRQRIVTSRSSGDEDVVNRRRESPLPGILGRVPLPPYITKTLWSYSDGLIQTWAILEVYVHGMFEAKSAIGLQGTISLIVAVVAVLYFNLIDKPWWLTNLQGFAFSYSALQLMSPTTFWTGTLVLTSLFFYDIYFVFFTPLMITVATKLDIPVKLLFPRPPGADDDPSKKALSMLGLGDVVLPGIIIGLALRFDLYLYYLKMQRPAKGKALDGQHDGSSEVAEVSLESATETPESVVKAVYRPATGNWGERFWLGRQNDPVSQGGRFPKTYFYASVVGYITGMICTLCVMHVFRHGQPALLYLVPAVLISLWGTAFFRADFKTMWEYTEAEEQPEEKASKKNQSKEQKETKNSEIDKHSGSVIMESASAENTTSSSPKIENAQPGNTKSRTKDSWGRRLVMFSISLPKPSPSQSAPNGDLVTSTKKDAVLKTVASPDPSARASTQHSSHSPIDSAHTHNSLDTDNAKPAGKRQRLA